MDSYECVICGGEMTHIFRISQYVISCCGCFRLFKEYNEELHHYKIKLRDLDSSLSRLRIPNDIQKIQNVINSTRFCMKYISIIESKLKPYYDVVEKNHNKNLRTHIQEYDVRQHKRRRNDERKEGIYIENRPSSLKRKSQ